MRRRPGVVAVDHMLDPDGAQPGPSVRRAGEPATGQRLKTRRPIERHRSLLGRICSVSSRSHSFSIAHAGLLAGGAGGVGAVGELVAPRAVLADQHDAGAAATDVLDDRRRAAVTGRRRIAARPPARRGRGGRRGMRTFVSEPSAMPASLCTDRRNRREPDSANAAACYQRHSRAGSPERGHTVRQRPRASVRREPGDSGVSVTKRASTAIATNTIVRYVVDQWNSRIGFTASPRLIRPAIRCASTRNIAPTTSAGTR